MEHSCFIVRPVHKTNGCYVLWSTKMQNLLLLETLIKFVAKGKFGSFGNIGKIFAVNHQQGESFLDIDLRCFD